MQLAGSRPVSRLPSHWPYLFEQRSRVAIFTLAAIFLLAVTPPPSHGQECSHHDQSLEGLRISEVDIENGNIFDPERPDQNLWIHRIANDLHIKTRKETIEGLLLLQPDQLYSERLAQETERIIRAQDYIHDAEVIPEPVCAQGVKLKVVSTDNWTLTPSVSVGHSGGETRTAAKIEEANLLGMGIDFRLKHEQDEDRTQNTLSFMDNDWFGNRKQLEVVVGDNSDGYRYEINLSRPFYQLDSRDAWHVSLRANEAVLPIFSQGELSDEVGQTTEGGSVFYGWSDGLIDNSAARWTAGFAFSESRYFRTPDFPSASIPDDEVVRYPYLQYNYLEDEYFELTNFQVMGVTEDIAVGDYFSLTFGWKDEAFGSTQSGHVLALNYSTGDPISPRTFALYDLSLRHDGNDATGDTGFLGLGARLYHYRDPDHSYQFKASLEAARSPELFEQFTLGGSNGLKGYPIRYQNGDRKLALSVEKRNYFKWYPLQMFKLGTALFAETGSAWNSDASPEFIGDVGIGLRLVSTRQSNSKVLHADIAFPMSERDQVDSYQIFIEAQAQF